MTKVQGERLKANNTIPKMPKSLQRQLAREAEKNHRTISAEILHRLESSLAADLAEENLAGHLRRALAAEQMPIEADEVLEWADETFNQLERTARQK